MIHRTRMGPLKGNTAPGRSVTQIGPWFVEYSGSVPDQAALDAHHHPPVSVSDFDAVKAALLRKNVLSQKDIDDEKVR